jgi:hypothetical protein
MRVGASRTIVIPKLELRNERIMKSLIVAGLILNLLSAIFLYDGSRARPWEIQTWKGESEAELDFLLKRRRNSNIGFLLLFIGFLLQLIGSVT